MQLYTVRRIYFVAANSDVEAIQKAVEQEIPNVLIVAPATDKEAAELRRMEEADEQPQEPCDTE